MTEKLILSQQDHVYSQIFPGVRGFGTETRGGWKGRIIRVTTLSRDGAGSLAEAIRADGPRIVVFDVAGTRSEERRGGKECR